MLNLALNTGLPLISVTTDDTVNIADVLSHLTGTSVVKIDEGHMTKLGSPDFEKDSRFFSIENPDDVIYSTVYQELVSQDRTLIIINPDKPDPLFYNAGEVQVPTEMVTDFLAEIVDTEMVEGLCSVLGGLSLKDVIEICMLAQAQYKSLTPRGVMDIRRQYSSGLKGIQQISTDYNYYKSPKALNKWLSVEGKIFRNYVVPLELTPRGLMFTGQPGTGKTMAAKYLANELQVPLYRLDLGALLDKYIGGSEENLARALSTADHAHPCVLLLDEVEKLFGNSDDSGVSGRLLSALLWWMQERTSRILVVMTTNDDTNIPAELYRPGRIDEAMEFTGITDFLTAKIFMNDVLLSLYPEMDDSFYDSVVLQVEQLHSFPIIDDDSEAPVYTNPVSHAELTQLMCRAIKKVLVN